jgi:DoxX-like family
MGALPVDRVAELAAAVGVLVGVAWRFLGVAAAVGMAVVLVGALVAHRRAGDDIKHASLAVVALAVSLAYVASALIH